MPDMVNSVPDVFALLNSIDAQCSSGSVSHIHFRSLSGNAAYVGGGTFQPSLNRGYRITGDGISYPGQDNNLAGGTWLDFTASGGSAIDTSVNYGSVTGNDSQVFALEGIGIRGKSTNGTIVKLTNVQKITMREASVWGFSQQKSGTNPLSGSVAVSISAVSNQSHHLIDHCDLGGTWNALTILADHTAVIASEIAMFKNVGIAYSGGQDHSIFNVHCFGDSLSPGAGIQDNRPANANALYTLTIVAARYEGCNGYTQQNSGAQFVVVS